MLNGVNIDTVANEMKQTELEKIKEFDPQKDPIDKLILKKVISEKNT